MIPKIAPSARRRAAAAGLLAALAGLPASGARAGATREQASIAAAERDFNEATARDGLRAGFLAFMDDRAVNLRPQMGSAKAFFEQLPADRRITGPTWWPKWAAVSRSNDLGFSVGPFTRPRQGGYNFYFTVWARRSPDAPWRWMLDRGADTPVADTPHKPGAAVVYFEPGDAFPGGGPAAMRQVERLEAGLARALPRNPAAPRPYLAADALVMGFEAAPVQGAEALERALAARPKGLELIAMGGGASSAGDYVYTFGYANWTDGAGPRRGNYVRAWRYKAGRWRILVDEVVPSDT